MLPFGLSLLPSCISKLFECIILSRLFFFLKIRSILFSCQACFRPGRSTLDQILFLSQSISDGFSKPKPGYRTILATIDLLKLSTLSGISPFSKNLFRPASLLACSLLAFVFAQLVGLNLFFLIGACVIYQNRKSYSFRVCRGVPQGSVLGRLLFSLFMNDLPAFLRCFVSCFLYDGDLAI